MALTETNSPFSLGYTNELNAPGEGQYFALPAAAPQVARIALYGIETDEFDAGVVRLFDGEDSPRVVDDVVMFSIGEPLAGSDRREQMVLTTGFSSELLLPGSPPETAVVRLASGRIPGTEISEVHASNFPGHYESYIGLLNEHMGRTRLTLRTPRTLGSLVLVQDLYRSLLAELPAPPPGVTFW